MLRHIIVANSNKVSKRTGMALNEIYIGRYPRQPMTRLEGSGFRGHQSEKRDQLGCLEMMSDTQVREYRLIREKDRLVKAKTPSCQ